MGLPQEVMSDVFQVIQGGQGQTLGTPAQVIQFTSDNGQKAWNVVKQTSNNPNGTGFNYWVIAAYTLVQEVRMAVTAGAALLPLETGAFGLMVAPALGLTTGALVGNWLYNLNPNFWADVDTALQNAGLTINGKVVGFLDENGIMSFPPEAIEIFKNALLAAGAFDIRDDIDYGSMEFLGNYSTPFKTVSNSVQTCYTPGASMFGDVLVINKTGGVGMWMQVGGSTSAPLLKYYCASTSPFNFGLTLYRHDSVDLPATTNAATQFEYNGVTFYGFITTSYSCSTYTGDDIGFIGLPPIGCLANPYMTDDDVKILYLLSGASAGENSAIQNGAELPDYRYFPDLYPDWIPKEFPDISGAQLPDAYPLSYPDNLPKQEPYQDPAQNPDADPDANAEPAFEIITDPDSELDPDRDEDTGKDTDTEPDTEIDDSTDETEDIPPTPEVPPSPDPIDPDPVPIPTPVIPPSPTPTTASSSKLFTVYNPSITQLNALGAYLWDNSLMETIKKIWQNPLDGIISLIRVYATPAAGGSSTIMLGYLDSGVSAPVVTNQFVTINCGSVQLAEKRKNATDYTPYTSLSVYLPFVGIVELDINECMRGSINITYTVDVYTGSCLAEIKITRSPDTPNGAILYTFSGNCSQQIPLTSGDASGLLRGLLSATGAGISIASGGGLGLVAGATMVGQSLTHEMFHVAHSGNISANAGIMGHKKPYLIVNRQRPYTPNNYNHYYGFPINKTVYLNNCKGFTKVKAVRLKTVATDPERTEILALLKDGVIF